MKQYLELLEHVLTKGRKKSDRTGTGTLSTFGYEMRFDLTERFPLLTTKKLHFKSIATELLWFLRGDTNTAFLHEHGVSIWDEWADKNGNLGPIYGAQWRRWNDTSIFYDCDDPSEFKEQGYKLVASDYNQHEVVGVIAGERHIDQIENVLNLLVNDPDSRRMVVSAWNPGQLHKMALPPCHMLFQLYTTELTLEERIHAAPVAAVNEVIQQLPLFEPVYDALALPEDQKVDLICNMLCSDDGKACMPADLQEQVKTEVIAVLRKYDVAERLVSCKLTQRSADVFLGVPYNIASYALLVHLLCQQANLRSGFGRFVPGEFIHSMGDTHLYLNHLDKAKQQLSREPKHLPILELCANRQYSKPPLAWEQYTLDDFKLLHYVPHPHIPAPVAV